MVQLKKLPVRSFICNQPRVLLNCCTFLGGHMHSLLDYFLATIFGILLGLSLVLWWADPLNYSLTF